MSAQVIGPRKLRQAQERTGLPLDRVLRWSNRLWFGRFPTERGHAHVEIDPVTWEWERTDEPHWTSCGLYKVLV